MLKNLWPPINMAARNTHDLDLKTMQQVESCGFEPFQRKGAGSYGYVYEVSDYQGHLYAFKYILPNALYQKQGIDGYNLNEIDVLSRLNHPHILHATAIITKHNCEIDGMALVLPLADRTLLDLIKDPQVTTDMMIKPLAQISQALSFMHQNGVLHLDLKTNNIVIQGIVENYPYLIDFGLALSVNDVVTGKQDWSERVTLDYRAPELLGSHQGYNYNGAVDVWAFGIVMLYALRGGRGVYDVNWSQVTPPDLRLIIENLFGNPQTIPDLLADVNPQYRASAIDLVQSILQLDPAARPSAEDIARHPLFAPYLPSEPIGMVPDPYIKNTYGPNHRNILKLIFQWAKDIFSEADVELLFLSVDLYNRTAGNYEEKTALDQMTLAATCLWVAAKFVNVEISTVKSYAKRIQTLVPDITAAAILAGENEIIHLTNGILNVNALYKACSNLDELDFSYSHIVMNTDVKIYARLIIPEWVELLKQYIPDPQRPYKTGPLSQFM